MAGHKPTPTNSTTSWRCGKDSGIGKLGEGGPNGEWFTKPAEVTIDRDEITIVGTLVGQELSDQPVAESAAAGRVSRWR